MPRSAPSTDACSRCSSRACLRNSTLADSSPISASHHSAPGAASESRALSSPAEAGLGCAASCRWGRSERTCTCGRQKMSTTAFSSRRTKTSPSKKVTRSLRSRCSAGNVNHNAADRTLPGLAEILFGSAICIVLNNLMLSCLSPHRKCIFISVLPSCLIRSLGATGSSMRSILPTPLWYMLKTILSTSPDIQPRSCSLGLLISHSPSNCDRSSTEPRSGRQLRSRACAASRVGCRCRFAFNSCTRSRVSASCCVGLHNLMLVRACESWVRLVCHRSRRTCCTNAEE
mmetsp:Transcript_59382/g.170634  ORF Transcript_59382/g.170634 Transcript_59382/m.170634 type:complete len:287 (+) Transcript_59382:940-1800(+)